MRMTTALRVGVAAIAIAAFFAGGPADSRLNKVIRRSASATAISAAWSPDRTGPRPASG